MSSPAQTSFVAADLTGSNVEPIVTQFVFDLVAQTLVFGVYTLLLCLSVRMLFKRGLKMRANMVMLCVVLFTYLLSAGYWVYTVVYAADLLRAHINVAATPISTDEITEWLSLFSAVAMINFILTDGVIIWKARVICQRQLRKYLWISTGFLVLTAVAVAATISLIMVLKYAPKSTSLDPTVIQSIAWALSLASSLSATAVVAVTALRHLQIVRKGSGDEQSVRSGQVLSWVTTLGLLYCLFTLMALISSFITLPNGTLGDLYGPLSFHIAGAFPPAMILLVDADRPSSESTTFPDSASVSGGYSFPPPARFGNAEASHHRGFGSVDASPTTTVVGHTRSISGPDIIHPLRKTVSNASRMSTPKHSRFSDNSLDPRRNV
ncbi:hypothetical protein K438DRAFT_667941 [Mycena galopus ATCC 62051]|nr:hypothetical protein K438DRAFT_667941 [Mycena galopus ATCC 62051]